MDFIFLLLLVVNSLSLFYMIIMNSIYSFQLIVSAIGLAKHVKTRYYSDHSRYLDSENTIPISLLVPAYNESATIIDNVKNLLALDFPEYEVIVINDGSNDDTLGLLVSTFNMQLMQQPIKRSIETQEIKGVYRSAEYQNLIVLDKENGGKADALNAGINASRYPVFVSIDADSLLERDSLIRMIMPFIKDHRVIGVGGIVRIESGNDIVDGEIHKVSLSKNPLVNLQVIEYLRAFLTGRIAFSRLGVQLIVSGAFGAFNKRTVIDAGGYTVGTIGEDMELVVKLHQYIRENKLKYIIQFIPDPVCWTQPPETLSDLQKQRKRWQIGLVSSIMLHRKMLFNPRYGRIGTVSMPYYFIFEMLGPFFEVLGYILIPVSFFLGAINLSFCIAFYAVSVLYGVVLSVGALILEENTFKKYPSVKQLLLLIFYAIIDNFGYRQANTFFRVQGMLTYKKNKNTWGSIKRKSFGEQQGDE